MSIKRNGFSGFRQHGSKRNGLTDFARPGLVAVAFAIICHLPAGAIELDYDALRGLAKEEQLKESIGYFSGLGSRVVGYPGADQAATFIQNAFEDLGLHKVDAHAYDVSIPVEKGGFLRAVLKWGRKKLGMQEDERILFGCRVRGSSGFLERDFWSRSGVPGGLGVGKSVGYG